MKKLKINKFLILIIATILLSTTFVSGSYNISEEVYNQYNMINFSPPLPGCMKTDKPEMDFIYQKSIESEFLIPEILSYDQNIGFLIDSVDEDIYLNYLEELVEFGPRVTTTDACQNSGVYIYNEFIEMGIDARIQEWAGNNLFGTNIEGTIQGVDETSDEIYIICAHYDSVPESPGADDDGSGVAAVLTAAYYLSQFTFNHTIKFVTFSGEEQGLFGSYYYVDEALLNDDNIVAVLNADMIGFAKSEEDSSYVHIFEDDQSLWLAEYAVDVSEEYYDKIDIEINRAGYTYGSDHYRFWQGGYSAIFYAEVNFNDYYHSPNDIIENMNIPYAVKNTKLMVATLAELSEIANSNSPLKPDIPKGPSNGKPGEEYTFSANTIDPDGDNVYYMFDWDNDEFSEWLGPYPSGETVESNHIWPEKGEYEIRVKAKDEIGLESKWSDPLVVSMPKNKFYNRPFISFLLENTFFKNFLRFL